MSSQQNFGQHPGNKGIDSIDLKELLECAPDAMIIVNSEGFIQLVNEQVQNIFGYSKEELLGQKIEILIPERFRNNHTKHLAFFFENPKTRPMGAGFELSGVRKNGEEFPVEISLSPIGSENNRFVTAAIRDISDRKKATQQFQQLLESAPDAMVIVNHQGIIQLVNEQVRNIFGYENEELLNQKVEILIPKRFHDSHGQHRSGFFASPKMRPMGAGLELSGVRKNGEEFPVEISLSPIETENGKLVTAAIRDISDRKKAEQALQDSMDELNRKNKELAQFAYAASHDLQEPLRTVKSFVELLEKQYSGQFDERATKYFNFITDASTRMSDLIKGLLDYSRIGRDRVFQPVDCNRIMGDVKADLGALINETHAELEVTPLPEKLIGSETELRLLFQNLISNAIKFRKKDAKPVIRISSESAEDSWKFSFRDNGIGIAEEHWERIFNIFQRLHNKNAYEGTGIGLAHCKKITDLHGGKIWVNSNPNEGSTFYVTLKKHL